MKKIGGLFICVLLNLCSYAQSDWIIKPIYDSAQEFKIGIAVVEIGGKYGAIDQYGNVIIPIKYTKKSSKLKSILTTERSKNMSKKTIIQDDALIVDSQNGKWGYRKYSLKDHLDSCVGSWELYERRNIGTVQDYFSSIGISSYEEYLKLQIEKDINNWQKKGEFETFSKEL